MILNLEEEGENVQRIQTKVTAQNAVRFFCGHTVEMSNRKDALCSVYTIF